MIEDDYLPDLTLANPVASLHDVSRDLTCPRRVRARRRPAAERRSSCSGSTWSGRRSTSSKRTPRPRTWRSSSAGRRCSRALEDDPLQLHRELDWVAKYRLLEGYRERDGLEWSDPKLRLDRPAVPRRPSRQGAVPPARRRRAGRAPRHRRGGRSARSMEPPEDTRAYFRGRCISRFPDAIAAARWDSIIFDTGPRRAAARPDARAAPGHAGPRRRSARASRRPGDARRPAHGLARGLTADPAVRWPPTWCPAERPEETPVPQEQEQKRTQKRSAAAARTRTPAR